MLNSILAQLFEGPNIHSNTDDIDLHVFINLLDIISRVIQKKQFSTS